MNCNVKHLVKENWAGPSRRRRRRRRVLNEFHAIFWMYRSNSWILRYLICKTDWNISIFLPFVIGLRFGEALNTNAFFSEQFVSKKKKKQIKNEQRIEIKTGEAEIDHLVARASMQILMAIPNNTCQMIVANLYRFQFKLFLLSHPRCLRQRIIADPILSSDKPVITLNLFIAFCRYIAISKDCIFGFVPAIYGQCAVANLFNLQSKTHFYSNIKKVESKCSRWRIPSSYFPSNKK